MSNPSDDDDRLAAPLEKVFGRVRSPIEEFIHQETSSGLLLMACTVIALVVANSPLDHAYRHLLHTPISFALGGMVLEKSLHHWINDGLMALFFFVVGLEIKREVLVGELSDPRQATLPVVAAIGGMAGPALIYSAVNFGGPAATGWGIPMATDIAFAVGVMVLLGKRIPKSLFTFLIALAIVDDLGSVVVIALFYTEKIALMPLALALLLVGLLVLLNLFGIRRPLPYALVGGLLWLAMLESGIHATLAGVLTALTIPAGSRVDPRRFSGRVRGLMDDYDEACRHSDCTSGPTVMANTAQHSILQTLENGVHLVESPLQRLEHALHLPVALLIIPLFALANAGIPIDAATLGRALTDPVALGVTVGLVLGKVLGIAGSVWLALRFGLGRLPAGTRFAHIVGVSLLGGIGFTMSIFIADLAFLGQAQPLLMAKTGILAASLLAGSVGLLWLWRVGAADRRNTG